MIFILSHYKIILELDIEVSVVDLVINNGDHLIVETNNKYIKARQNGDKFYITEKSHSIFNNDNSDLVVYIPSDYIFDSVAIENGAGRIDVETLSCKKLYLDLGAGKINMDNLLVLNETEIDGGAGTITIEDSSLNNLDLDMGMGKLSLTSKITGESEIDAGVGEVDLNLIGTINDYKIKLDKGIGSAKFNKENMKSNTYYGSGLNIIDIDGGVGSIKIDFLDI